MSYPVRRRSTAPPAIRRDPFAALEAVQERLNRLFGDAFTGYRGRTPFWHPDVDVSEADDGWLVEVRLPGVAPEEVAVEITDRELHVRAREAEVEIEPTGNGGGERQHPSKFARRVADFAYRLTVPADVDTDRIEATMDHGLLSVHLPRSKADRSRRINVGRSPGTIDSSSQETPESEETESTS
jgi:HSP20 family protein